MLLIVTFGKAFTVILRVSEGLVPQLLLTDTIKAPPVDPGLPVMTFVVLDPVHAPGKLQLKIVAVGTGVTL